MIFQKFTLLSKKLATLEDSGTGFGCFNSVLILEWIRLYIIIDKPSHPNFYPIQIFPAKTIDVKYIISNINLFPCL